MLGHQDEIIAWVAAQEDGTNAGFVFGAVSWRCGDIFLDIWDLGDAI